MTPPVVPAPEEIAVTRRRRSHPNALCFTTYDMELFFGASKSTIYRWAEQGAIPSETIGGKIIFPKNKVEPFLRKKGIIQ